MSDQDTGLHLPEQVIPVPTSVSLQGQAYLAAAARRIGAMAASGGAGEGGGQEAAAAAAVRFLRPLAAGFSGGFETIDLPTGAKLYRATPDARQGRLAEVAYFDIHGGGFTSGGGEMCQLLAKIRAADYGTEVFAVDYRLAPQHPYPAGLDDCIAAYREVLSRCDVSGLIVGGASAGGNLAAALMLRARDEGLPLPIALLLQTPGLDMTRSGDSYRTNRLLDVNLYGGSPEGPSAYAGNTDPRTPYLSPLFGDFSQGWPPTILTTGTRDLLLSDTVQMHRALRRAGVAAELHVSEASPHGGFMGAGAPEDAEIVAECRRFLYTAWRVP
jgi:monoterpene epsilon-lactone hydrolase